MVSVKPFSSVVMREIAAELVGAQNAVLLREDISALSNAGSSYQRQHCQTQEPDSPSVLSWHSSTRRKALGKAWVETLGERETAADVMRCQLLLWQSLVQTGIWREMEVAECCD